MTIEFFPLFKPNVPNWSSDQSHGP